MTQPPPEPFVLTPVYDLLLRGSADMPVGLYHLHLAMAEQLTRLHYRAGTLKTVKKRLKLLVDNGYIQADAIPTKRFKSPYYYTLAAKGMRYLAHIGLDTDASFRASKERSEGYLYLRHALELNDITIAALLLKRMNPRYYLSRYVTERTLKRSPYKVRDNGTTTSLIPDGFLAIRERRASVPERSLALILEHDRGTEQQAHFKRRIRAYRAFLRDGGHQQLFGVEQVTVVFTTFIDSRRVMQMRAWTGQELQTDPALAQRFVFAALPQPLGPQQFFFEPRWYTLTDEQPIALIEG